MAKELEQGAKHLRDDIRSTIRKRLLELGYDEDTAFELSIWFSPTSLMQTAHRLYGSSPAHEPRPEHRITDRYDEPETARCDACGERDATRSKYLHGDTANVCAECDGINATLDLWEYINRFRGHAPTTCGACGSDGALFRLVHHGSRSRICKVCASKYESTDELWQRIRDRGRGDAKS